MTRICHGLSCGHARMAGCELTLSGSSGHSMVASPRDSRCPTTTQVCVTGSCLISMEVRCSVLSRLYGCQAREPSRRAILVGRMPDLEFMQVALSEAAAAGADG